MKFILFLLISAQAAFASGSTLYDQGNRLYGFSGMPSPSRFLGWYSGRCFSASQPNTKIAALLTSYRSSSKYKAVFWSDRKQPEDYYDHPTPEMIQEIEDGLKQYDPDIPYLLPRVDHWEATHLGAHKDATRTRANLASIVVQALHDDVQTMVCVFKNRVR